MAKDPVVAWLAANVRIMARELARLTELVLYQQKLLMMLGQQLPERPAVSTPSNGHAAAQSVEVLCDSPWIATDVSKSAVCAPMDGVSDCTGGVVSCSAACLSSLSTGQLHTITEEPQIRLLTEYWWKDHHSVIRLFVDIPDECRHVDNIESVARLTSSTRAVTLDISPGCCTYQLHLDELFHDIVSADLVSKAPRCFLIRMYKVVHAPWPSLKMTSAKADDTKPVVSWTQDPDEVEITVKLPRDAHKSGVRVVFQTHRLQVVSSGSIILNRELTAACRPNDSYWTWCPGEIVASIAKGASSLWDAPFL